MKKAIRLLSVLMGLMLVFTTLGVYATWYYTASSVPGVTDKINIALDPWVDLPDQGITIANKFLNILNNKEGCDLSINGVPYTNTFDALLAAFNSSPKSGRITLHNNSYIGTMQTTGQDAAAIRTLFGETLLNEESATPEYQLMLKREPLDNNHITGANYFMDGDHNWVEENAYYPGSEMVLFSTNWKTDPNIPSGYVLVYATVYTRHPKTDENGNYLYELDENGNIQYHTYVNQYGRTITTNYPIYQYDEWVKISGEDGYVGYAMVVDYSTGDKTRSFATNTWRSLISYHGVSAGSSLNQVVQAIPKNNS